MTEFAEKPNNNFSNNNHETRYQLMDKIAEQEGYVKLSEASKIFNVSQSYLNVLIHRNKVEGKKFGRNWYTKKEAIEQYLENKSLLLSKHRSKRQNQSANQPQSYLKQNQSPNPLNQRQKTSKTLSKQKRKRLPSSSKRLTINWNNS